MKRLQKLILFAVGMFLFGRFFFDMSGSGATPVDHRRQVAGTAEKRGTIRFPAERKAPQSGVHSMFWRQGLSHMDFHSVAFVRALTRIFFPHAEPGYGNGNGRGWVRSTGSTGGGRFERRPSVAVVGVEYGAEVASYLASGFEVHLFEPLPPFVEYLERTYGSNNNVHLYPMALGPEEGSLKVQYQKEDPVVVPMSTLNSQLFDSVDSSLSFLSVDTQGSEEFILRGAMSALTQGKIKVILIEVIACEAQQSLIDLLLDAGFVLFDFIPWGTPSDPSINPEDYCSESYIYSSPPSHYTPSPLEDSHNYADAFCDLAKAHSEWSFLQTDIIAVHSSFLTQEHVDALNHMYLLPISPRCLP